MEDIKLQQAAKAYQEKEHDIWTGKGLASDLQKNFYCRRRVAEATILYRGPDKASHLRLLR